MKKNIDKVKESFQIQAEGFENPDMNFSKEEFLDYTVKAIKPSQGDKVLEAACGTCVCGRSMIELVDSVTCLDATRAMLDVGEREAKKRKLTKMTFIQGMVEDMPFLDETFDIVISRLGFHHFDEIEKPFKEMKRVLKKGGRLVIIDMEAASEEDRRDQDRLERMRDFSHVKNISKREFIKLYEENNFIISKNETSDISVSLEAWMKLTDTSEDLARKIRGKMRDDISGKIKTGFNPYLKEDEIYFWQKWLLIIGEK